MRQCFRLFFILSAALSGTSLLPDFALAEDCQSLLDEFNRTIDSGDDGRAQSLVDKIAISADCGRYQVPVQRRLAARRLSVVQFMMARGRPVADYDRLLLAAQSPEVLWQASATMGEVRFGERRFVDAAQAYDLAIEIIKNESLTAVAPSKFDIEGLIERAGEARLLAANGAGSGGREKFVKTARDQRDGTLGGVLFALRAWHRSPCNPRTNYFRVSDDGFYQCWTGRRARIARGFARAKTVTHFADRPYRCSRDCGIQLEIVARQGRCGRFVSQAEWISHCH